MEYDTQDSYGQVFHNSNVTSLTIVDTALKSPTKWKAQRKINFGITQTHLRCKWMGRTNQTACKKTSPISIKLPLMWQMVRNLRHRCLRIVAKTVLAAMFFVCIQIVLSIITHCGGANMSASVRQHFHIDFCLMMFCFYVLINGSLTRYVKLRVAHAPGMPGTFSPQLTSKGTAC